VASKHSSHVSLIAGIALAVALLAGCAPTDLSAEPDESAAPTDVAVPTPTPTPTPTEDPARVFTEPSSCVALLGAALEAEFLAAGNVLFSSTDGAGIYFPIDSEQGGGTPFSCWYGKDMVDLSTFELAAQSLTQDAHEGTVSVLSGLGMTQTMDGDIVTFTQVGDEGSTPAIIHVLYPDGWITGYSAFGGQKRVDQLAVWVATVGEQVHGT
jgi:hypothetical protein